MHREFFEKFSITVFIKKIFYIILALLLLSSCTKNITSEQDLVTQGRDKKSELGQNQNRQNKIKKGYLIIRSDSVPRETFDNYIRQKESEYIIDVASIAEINAWCYPNFPDTDFKIDACDDTEVPVMAGNESDAVLLPRENLEDFCRELGFVSRNDPANYCISSWPSIVRSFLIKKNNDFFNNNLQNVLIAAEQEKFPYVVIFDHEPTFLYYGDLTDHDWDRNNDNKLAMLYYLDPDNPTIKPKHPQLLKLYGEDDEQEEIPNYKKCDSLENACDATDLQPFFPEVAIGMLPFEDPEKISKILNDSTTVEIERPERLQNGLFGAVSTFINHDSWIPTNLASRIWQSKFGKKSTEIFGEGEFSGKPGIVPYPRPNCGSAPADREECWFDKAKETGFGYSLFNTHGLPDNLVDLIELSEIDENNFDNVNETIYASIACLNLGANPIQSFSLDTMDYTDSNKVIVFEQNPSMTRMNVFDREFEYSTTINFRALNIYKHNVDDKDGDDFLLFSEEFTGLMSEVEGEYTLARKVENDAKYSKHELQNGKLRNIDEDSFPEMISVSEDYRKLLVFTDMDNVFEDGSLRRYEYELPMIDRISSFELVKSGDNKNYILVLPWSRYQDPLLLVEIDNAGMLINIEEIDSQSPPVGDDILHGDFNKDHSLFPDLIVGSMENGFSVSFGTENGDMGEWNKIDSFPMGVSVRDPITADVNNDGYHDIIVRQFFSGGIRIYLYNPEITTWEYVEYLDSPFFQGIDLQQYHIGAADLDHDGNIDIFMEVGAKAGNESKFKAGIVYVLGSGDGNFESWNISRSENRREFFDNVARKLLEKGNARAFLGAIPYTLSSAVGATLAETEFTKQISSGLILGDALKNTMRRYMEDCTKNTENNCGFANYKDQLWDFFAFHMYGDPTARIPSLR